MGKSKAYQMFLESTVVPKAQRIAVRQHMRELQKQAEFWNYLNLVWKKYQQKRCYYCGIHLPVSPNAHFKDGTRREWEIDHKVAIYYGGTNAPFNLCLACKPCNRNKSADLMERDIESIHHQKKRRTKARRTGKIYF